MTRLSLRGSSGTGRRRGAARALGVLAIAATLAATGGGLAGATPETDLGQDLATTATTATTTPAPRSSDTPSVPRAVSTQKLDGDRIGSAAEQPPSAAVNIEKPEREPGKKKLTGMDLVRSQQHALTVPADQLPELSPGAVARSQRSALPDGISQEDAELSERMAMVANANCQFYFPSPHAVCGAIRDKYNAMGGQFSFLGIPTSPEYQNPGNTGARSEFLHGSIYWSTATGAHPITPLFMTKWQHYGWEAGSMGYPTTDEIPNGDNLGSHQNFQHANAAIYWNSAITGPPGLSVIKGLIRAKWDTLGAQTPGSLLGYPSEDERALPDGQGHMSRFERGVIYWSPTTGAHPVTGVILAEWAESGYETGYYGYPLGDEFDMNPGRKQEFQNDYIDFGTLQSISQTHYDCELNQSWPDATNSTTWVRSSQSAVCSDPKLQVKITTQFFYTAPGSKSEMSLREVVGVKTQPLPIHSYERSYKVPCENGTYRARTKFEIINWDGGVLPSPDPHRSDPVTVSNCRSIPPVCPPSMTQPDCNATVDAYLFALRKNFATRPNYAGNKPFQDKFNHLPAPLGEWLEYDVYLPDSNNDRRPERLVLDKGNRIGKIWFSKDHFTTQGGWTGWTLD